MTTENPNLETGYPCLLYTSDAADERSSVDLGGRRIIKKKKTIKQRVALTVTKTKIKSNTNNLEHKSKNSKKRKHENNT